MICEKGGVNDEISYFFPVDSCRLFFYRIFTLFIKHEKDSVQTKKKVALIDGVIIIVLLMIVATISYFVGYKAAYDNFEQGAI